MTDGPTFIDTPTRENVGTNRRNMVRVLRSGVAVAALSTPLNVLVLPFVLQRVALQRYGEWATLATVISVAQLADAGISTDVARRVAEARGRGSVDEVRHAVQRGLTVISTITVCVVGVAALASGRVVNVLFPTVDRSEHHTILLVYLGMLALVAAGLLMSGYLAALGGLQRSDYQAWGSLAGLVSGTLVTVIAAALGAHLWALFAGASTRSLVGWAIPAVALRRLQPDLRFRLARLGFRESLSFVGMPAMLLVASVGNLFAYQIDKFVLSHFKGAKDAGLYQIALNLVLQAEGLAIIPLGVLLAATAEWHRTDAVRLNRLERVATAACLSIAALVLGALATFSGSFYHVWLGPEYHVSAYATRVLAAGALITLVAAPWYYYMLGRALYRYIVVGSVVNLVVNLTCTVVLTPRFGITGALIGTVTGSILSLFVSWRLLLRVDRRRWIASSFRPYFAAGVVTGLAFAIGRIWHPRGWLTLSGSVLAYLVVTSILLLLLKAAPLQLSYDSRRVKVSLNERV